MPAQIVLASGTTIAVYAELIRWTSNTEDRYERSELLAFSSSGNAALAPKIQQGWKTYNFEVEGLNTYVAGGVRVHNQSARALAAGADEFEEQFGHRYEGTAEDNALLADSITSGRIQFTGADVDVVGNDRFKGPFFTTSGDKIIISANSTTWFASMVRNGEVGRIIQNNSDGSRVDSQYDSVGRLQTQEDVFTNGTSAIKYLDNRNTHPYTDLEVDKDATGKITAAKPKLDGQPASNTIDFSVVGQVLGSALGRALAPNNQFVQLAAGTVVGAVGQKLAQAFVASLTTDAASFNPASVFSDFNVNIASAGASSVASFLIAELGTALHLEGFGAQLFNAGAGGFAGSVASQIATKMVHDGVSFAAAMGTLDFGAAASSAAYGISALLGGYLGHELVPAETHTGAVAGQLLGAVGSAIGISAALTGVFGTVLGFIVPGIGSLMGTVLGTLIGDALAPHPHPAAIDLIDQVGYLYGYTHSQISASDGGDYSIPDPMAAAAVSIINTYLGAVKGAALDHSMQTQIGYVTDPSFRYIDGWAPTHKYYSFLGPDDAVHRAALDVLQHTEVIGGDLLLKRAHRNSAASIPDPEPEWAGLITPSSQSGTEKLATLSADLSVAQDYQNYLNNREAINALIAANPDSAFAAGWIATFARVNDLGLNHMNASDFLGGLVGYLDSVNKAGLGAEAANATVYRGAGNTVVVEIKISNSAEVPGSLSVFADQLKITSDASGQTLQFTVDSGIVASGEHFLGAGASAGDGANDLWIGAAAAENIFTGTGGHDILVGGTMNDVIYGGGGWDFIDGGYGNDYLFGQDGSDILRGGANTDFLFGGLGNDSYVFNRGDGADTVLDEYNVTTDTSHWKDEWRDDDGDGVNEFHHDWIVETTTSHPDAGTDTLLFGPGIAQSDIFLVQSGNDLVVYVKDPAHPGALTDNITLRHWFDDPKDRVEKFVFAGGTTLDLSSGVLAPYLVPFGETLSRSSVVEKSAIGTVVGTVAGFDFTGANLSYTLIDNAGGRFAINASTGVLTVAGTIDYNAGHSWQIAARVSDGAHVFDKAFTINVIDMPNHAPALTMAATTIKANPGQSLQVSSWFSASDADNDALSYHFQDATLAANSGQFVLNGTPLGQGATFGLTAAQLAGLTFVTSAEGVADDMSMQLSDGYAVSTIGEMHVNLNHAPVLTVPAASITINAGQALQVSTLFSVTDADNDALNYYFRDGDAPNSGHFMLNGTSYANGANFGVSAAQLANLVYVTGAEDIADDVWMQMGDGYATTAIGQVHLDINHAPDAAWFGGTVREHSANGTRVGSLAGRDPDAANVLSYSLLSDAGGRFAINDASSGVVTVKDGTLLDHTTQSYTLMVRITDQGGLFYDKPVTVNVAPGPVNNPDGTSTVTIYDTADAFGWSSFKSTYNGPDGHGSLLSQLGTNDGGSTWQNVYDIAHTQSWDYTASTFDATNHLLTRATTNDDGTHSLLVNDQANTAAWTTFTMNFDAAWQYVSTSNVVMDPGQTFDIGQVWGAYDTLTWYEKPYVVGPAPVPTVSDFNGDGKTDMLLLNDSTRGWYVCQMNGAHIGVNAQIGTLTAGWHYDRLGDFNADGKSDVVLLNDTTHGVYVVEMDGIEMGSNGLVGNVRADLGWYYKGLGEFNNDGKSDIILFNDGTHEVYIIEMDGWQMGPNKVTGAINAGWTYQTLGDFNGDGKSDFLFLNDTTHDVKLWQMDGTDIAADQVIGAIDAAQGWHFKDAADFNGDGKSDLLLLNDNNHLMIWQMDGMQTPLKVDIGAAPAGTHFLDTGDFNGDGKADLAFLNDTTHAVTVWQMNGTQVQATAQVGTVLTDYHYVGQGDFNGDGKSDLVFQNDATRAEQLWQMNGTEILENSQMALLTAGWHLAI